MSVPNLRVLALWIIAFSIPSYAQSLGDVARQVRAERQKNGTPHARVITNEDLYSPETAQAGDATREAVPEMNENDAVPPAQAASKEVKNGTDSKKLAEPGSSTKDNQVRKHSAKDREAQELEIEKRTKEINRVYLDRIATLRTQLNTAQSELGKLQQGQLDSTNDFRRTLGVSPNPGTYEQQQRSFNEQIQAQGDLISNLNSQLEDAKESARHAGVPHASD